MNVAVPAAVDLDLKNKSRTFESYQENTKILDQFSSLCPGGRESLNTLKRNSRVQCLHHMIVKTPDRIWIGQKLVEIDQ
jgi:hypothetical protein